MTRRALSRYYVIIFTFSIIQCLKFIFFITLPSLHCNIRCSRAKPVIAQLTNLVLIRRRLDLFREVNILSHTQKRNRRNLRRSIRSRAIASAGGSELTSTSTNGLVLLKCTNMGKNSESSLACASNSKDPLGFSSSTAPIVQSILSPDTSYTASKLDTAGSLVWYGMVTVTSFNGSPPVH